MKNFLKAFYYVLIFQLISFVFLCVLFLFIYPLKINASEITEELRGTSTIPSLYTTTTPIKEIKIKETPDISIEKNKILNYTEIADDIVLYSYYGNQLEEKEILYNNKFIKESKSLRTKNSRSYILEDNLIRTDFYPATNFIKNANGNWYIIEKATTSTEKLEKKLKLTFLDYLFFNPVYAFDEIIYSGIGDGKVSCENATWSNCISASSGTNNDYTSTSAWCGGGQYGNGFYVIDQNFFSFDTKLPDIQNIATATLSIYINEIDIDDNDEYAYLALVGGTQTSTSSLSNTDYNNVINSYNDLIILSETIDLEDISTGGFLEINFNELGKSFISSTSDTKIVMLEGHFINNQAFNSELGTYTHFNYATANYTGTDRDPFLSINYLGTITPTFYMNKETGLINQSIVYKEIYDETGSIIGYEYEINHNPFITYGIIVGSNIIFFIFIFLILKMGFKKKDKILNEEYDKY